MPRGRVANTMATFTEIPISHSAKELSLVNYHQKIPRAIKQIIKKTQKKGKEVPRGRLTNTMATPARIAASQLTVELLLIFEN